MTVAEGVGGVDGAGWLTALVSLLVPLGFGRRTPTAHTELSIGFQRRAYENYRGA